MAIQSIPLLSQIRLQLNAGNDRFIYRTINNVKPTASDEDVYAVAVAIASLQTFLLRLIRITICAYLKKISIQIYMSL
ncbi:DUF1659 domain-containing protein [Thermotoga profunda]|uniref:DUF1659 domain-containing protein n=1 Tax=Thermotoga profunda TaxID=1508420 RepID=UPI00059700A5|nr:DUF1659 domain-containing protein [Thermotoga profunda]